MISTMYDFNPYSSMFLLQAIRLGAHHQRRGEQHFVVPVAKRPGLIRRALAALTSRRRRGADQAQPGVVAQPATAVASMVAAKRKTAAAQHRERGAFPVGTDYRIAEPQPTEKNAA